jgi:predicted RNase H-like nuclease (RuvC/YqgF family)
MELKNSKIFNKEIMQSVSAFCESEGIKNIDHFMYLCFKQGFDIKRYGLLGKTLNDGEKDLKIGGEQEKWVEKEIIVEKRVEIPVEVIKEVEKIVEVIKEVPVEKVVTKIEYISDKTTEDELGEIITNLKDEMSKKNKDLDELRQNLNILKENDKTKLLQETLQNLRTELQQKNEQIKELEKINRALLNGNQNQSYLLKGSNLKDRI